MSLQVERLEKNMAKLTIEVPAEELEKALQNAYLKNRKQISVPGFRKGKVPRQMIEKMYGPEVFYDDAANALIPDAYAAAADECELELVSRPRVSVVKIAKGEPFVFTAEVAVKPEVALGEYKGIEVAKAEAVVTDEDVEKELEADREKNGRLVSVEDRPVEDGDQTVIDFKGFIDGKAFEGGEGEDYELTIGSHSFIDTFEEQLIGKKIGEACEVLVTFPEEYHAPDLAGKPARFEVTVKEIRVKELPELNDEFASEVSDFETLAEYKDDIRAKLQERKERQAAAENENNVIEKVVENAQMELPQPMIDTQARGMVEDYARNLRRQGLNFNDYMKYTGMTVEKIMEQMAPQAEKRIRTRLVLEKVAEVENIQISDDAVDQEIEKMAASYKMDPARMKENMGEREREQLKEDLMVQEAVDFLVSEAKLV